MLSDEISLPLPESGESLDRPAGFDVSADEPDAVNVGNNDGNKSKSLGRDGRFYAQRVNQRHIDSRPTEIP
jgi:hypothetical protein